MAVFTVTTANWNDPSFWSSINLTGIGNTLDFSALPAGYEVEFDAETGVITITDGATTFTIGDTAATGGPYDATLGGSTDLEYFDTVIGGASYTFVNGDAGDDVITGGSGDDNLFGGWNDDGNDTIHGGDGNDYIDGGGGNDQLYGEAGSDWIAGGWGDDGIDGGSGDDRLIGERGSDGIEGGTGDDVIQGGEGADKLLGGDGADDIYGNYGDEVDGGEGGIDDDTLYVYDVDHIDYTTAEDGTVYFNTGETLTFTNIETVTTLSSDGIVSGTAGDDEIDVFYKDADGDWVDGWDALGAYGVTGDGDYIEAGAGNDSISAGVGDDIVYAGSGDDYIASWDGNDLLYGGTGDDYFVIGWEQQTAYGEDDADTFEVYATQVVDGGAGGVDDDTLIASDVDHVQLTAIDSNGNGWDGTVYLNSGDTITFSEIENFTIDGASWGPSGIVDGTAGDDVMNPGYADGDGDEVDGIDGDNDVILAGDGNDVIHYGYGDNVVYGGAGNDTIDDVDGDAYFGDDTLYGEAGDDIILGGAGDDVIYGGTGADYMSGEDDSDTFVIENNFGDDTIYGGEYDYSGPDNDVLDLSNVTEDLSIDLTDANAETGTFTNGTDTANFHELETIILGGGTDTLVLADGGGDDVVQSFDAPTDNGDGTFTGADQLDVSGLTSDGGTTPITTADVTVTDTNGDGTGDAILSFPGGESITLVGVLASEVSDTQALVAMGIPLGSSDPVDGTAGDDVMNPGYTDADGDQIDGADGNDDVILAGDGNDIVNAGDGDDKVYGGSGNDTLSGGTGKDEIYGGDGDDTVTSVSGDGVDQVYLEGGDDTFTMVGGGGNDHADGGSTNETVGDTYIVTSTNDQVTTNLNADGTGTVSLGSDVSTINDFEIFRFEADTTDDFGAGYSSENLTVSTFGGDDAIETGSGNDTIDGGTGDDKIDGGAGADTITGGAGNDTIDVGLASGGGADGAVDTLVFSDGDGADTVISFEAPIDNGDGTFTGQDQFDVSGLTSDGGTTPVNVSDVTVTDTNGDGTGDAILTFPGGESITLAGVLAGDIDNAQALNAMGIPLGLDYIVEGTAGSDLITGTYTGDPDGDMIDANDAADGSNDDLVYGYAGDDVIQSLYGDDQVYGGLGNDQIYGQDGNDILHGDAGNDALYGGNGNDQIYGGDGNDTIFAAAGTDYIDGGAGNDTVRFSGSDTVLGGDGDDLFRADSVTLDGTDVSITGGEGGETTGDTLYSGSYPGDVTVDLTAGGTAADPESGTMQLGTTKVTFTEIENIQTGAGNDTVIGSSGNDHINTGDGMDTITGGAGNDTIDLGAADGAADTLVFADGDGSDTVTSFEAPIDNGDGTFTGQDQFDVSGLTSDGGTTPVNVSDVTVTDTNGDGTGDAILTFPGGESITLTGVLPGDIDNAQALNAMGIPLGLDYIVEGTAGSDLINVTYTGDPDGDMIDANDAADGSNDDVVMAGSGDDTVEAGFGDDVIYGEAGNDLLAGDEGDDTLYGGTGSDSLKGGDGNDTMVLADGFGNDAIEGGELAETNGDTLDASAVTTDTVLDLTAIAGVDPESGTLSDGTDTASFYQIENIILGSGNDTVLGSSGNDEVDGGLGDDTFTGGEGNDTITGGAGNDTIIFADGDGDDTVTDFDLTDTDTDGFTNDQLDVSALTDAGGNPVNIYDVTVTDTNGDGSGDAILQFPNGESITLTGVDPATLDTPTLHSMGIPCFTSGTLIDTPSGQRPVECLRPGDYVFTADGAPQPVLWTGKRRFGESALKADERLRPVVIREGALGNRRELLVSQQHRVALGPQSAPTGFVPARWLAEDGGPHFRVANGRKTVTYVHLLLSAHAVIRAEGAPVESFYPGPQGLAALDVWTKARLFLHNPALGTITSRAQAQSVYGPLALPEIKRRDMAPHLAATLNANGGKVGKVDRLAS